jgi:hypothetical protein
MVLAVKLKRLQMFAASQDKTPLDNVLLDSPHGATIMVSTHGIQHIPIVNLKHMISMDVVVLKLWKEDQFVKMI